MGQGLVVLQLVKIRKVLQRRFLFGLCRGIQLLPGLGAAEFAVHPRQGVGEDPPAAVAFKTARMPTGATETLKVGTTFDE